MKDEDNNTISSTELNRIQKIAYRPEKSLEVLVIWQEINDTIFERSYRYTSYVDALTDYRAIRDLTEVIEKEQDMILNERV
jgi:hypothetical protein